MAQRSVAFVQQATMSAAIPVGQGRSSLTAVALAANGGGLGYKVGDILTVSGGTAVSGFTAKLIVTAVDNNGAILPGGVAIYLAGTGTGPGWYTTKPTNPVSVTGGTGSGATFTLTFADNVPPPGATSCNIVAEAQDVRYRGDGTAPTSAIGEILPKSAAGVVPLVLAGAALMRTMLFIEAAASAKLNIEFFKN